MIANSYNHYGDVFNVLPTKTSKFSWFGPTNNTHHSSAPRLTASFGFRIYLRRGTYLAYIPFPFVHSLTFVSKISWIPLLMSL